MIETIQVENVNGIMDFVRIVNGETATIMPKSEYERRQAEQSTPIVPA